jgi:hypothetical protein
MADDLVNPEAIPHLFNKKDWVENLLAIGEKGCPMAKIAKRRGKWVVDWYDPSVKNGPAKYA